MISKKRFIFAVFESKICRLVFILSLILGYFLTEKSIFYSYYSIIGFIYIILFGLVMTCMVRVIKEKVVNLKHTGASVISIIMSIFGFGALNTCGIGAPICSSGITIGFSSFFPNFMKEYSIYILLITIIFQISSLYYMGCFKKCLC